MNLIGVYFYIFINILNISVILTQLIPLGTPCTTPNNETLFCVPVKLCKVILDAMTTRDPVAIQFAKDSFCNMRINKQPQVCCGSYGTYIQKPQNNISKRKDLLPSRKICGFQHNDDRYVESTNYTAIDEFPWIVLIKYTSLHDMKPNKDFHCIGSLINRRYVLTAGICVGFQTFGIYYKYSAQLAEHHRRNESDCDTSLGFAECADKLKPIDVEGVYLHPHYSQVPLKNNIALLRLAENVIFTDYVRPICLPDAATPPVNIGDTVITSGWGVINTTGLQGYWDRLDDRYSEVKKRSHNIVIAEEECAKHHDRVYVNYSHMICTKDESICFGDSGGPAIRADGNFKQWIQVAVISGGGSCEENISYYELVAPYMSWIRLILNP